MGVLQKGGSPIVRRGAKTVENRQNENHHRVDPTVTSYLATDVITGAISSSQEPALCFR
jgi:hypothetical protein